MKNSKGHYCNNPVFISPRLIYNNHEDGCNEKDQQQTPAFSYVNQHFIQVILNIYSSYNKRDNQQRNSCNYPDGCRNSRKRKTDMRHQISPVELLGKIQEKG